jgi:hypothetical protein
MKHVIAPSQCWCLGVDAFAPPAIAAVRLSVATFNDKLTALDLETQKSLRS